MKVRTRLQISAALPVLLAVITALVLYRISSHVRDVMPKLKAANGISREAARMDRATFMYLLNPGASSHDAWMVAHKTLNEFLVEQPYLSDRDQSVLFDLQNRHKESAQLFRSMSEAIAKLPANTAAGSDVAVQGMLSQILERSRDIVLGAQTLAANAHDHSLHLQESAYLLLIAVSAVLAGILAVVSLALIARVHNEIDLLKSGMAAIAGDDVKHRLTVEGDDEMADLAKGFNRMAEEIESVRDPKKQKP